MRLYKMELYKLCHKKTSVIGIICLLVILLFYISNTIADERATVDGITYTGLKAVRVDRQITEEFKGILTDEKVQRIVEEYGFPKKVEEGWGMFRDANFLNQFVLSHLSDGYIYSWDDYQVATRVYPIADSDLEDMKELSGDELIFEYYRGWEVFMDTLDLGMFMGSVLILFSISGVFAGEGQIKMLQLLFTTREGKRKDISAKIMSSFTITLVIWIVVVSLNLLLCGSVYGLDGLECCNRMVLGWFPAWMVNVTQMYRFVPVVLLCSLFGLLSLCAITLCISAYCQSAFHAVIAAAVCWGAPVLIENLIGLVAGKSFQFLAAAPVYMILYDTISEIYNIWPKILQISIVVSVYCTMIAYWKYRKQ